MWENTYEKLKILQFPKLHQYHRLHFVIPMKNVTSQYDDFVDLFAWISQEIAGKKSAFQRDQYDDPNTISNKIILALRQLEYKTALQSQKLRNPFGEIICHILEFLVDKLLSIRGFKVNSLVYIDAQEVYESYLFLKQYSYDLYRLKMWLMMHKMMKLKILVKK